MSITHTRTAAALLVGLTLSAAPASAQHGRRWESDGRRNEDSRGRDETRGRDESRGRESRGDAPRADVDQQRRAQPRWNDRNDRDGGRVEPRYAPAPRVEVRPRIEVRPRVVVVPPARSYGYRSYPRRSYVEPYGYRPYGYRPGWSLDLYFGRPYGSHIYGDGGYGYYARRSGVAYGALRIVDAPRDARVFVDGYYAGLVDEYDGVFQRLNLEAGPHHVEIEVYEGERPLEFDVRIAPGDTVTYHARYY